MTAAPGLPSGITKVILHVVADAARGQLVVQQQRALAGRRRALERRAADADHRVPAENVGTISAPAAAAPATE